MKPVEYSDRIAARFMNKVAKDAETGCWNWLGFKDPKGYGRFQYGAKDARVAHQIAYGLWVGHMADGLQLDHLCRNTSCVNPEHLEAVTGAENMRRATGLRTHCPQGHQYTPENTYVTPQGHSVCRTCKKRSQRVVKEREKAERAARGHRKGGNPISTHCQNGHPLDDVHLYVSPTGMRACKTCKAARARAAAAAKREQRAS